MPKCIIASILSVNKAFDGLMHSLYPLRINTTMDYLFHVELV